MAKIIINMAGFKKLARKAGALQKLKAALMKAGVYAGAGLGADKVRARIKTIPEHKRGVPGGIRDYEREAMLDGLGITSIREAKGEYYASVGFGGYDDEMRPIPKIANSVMSGTSFSNKYPIIRIVRITKKDEITAAMRREMEQRIKEILK